MATEKSREEEEDDVEQTLINLKRVEVGQCLVIGFMMHMLMDAFVIQSDTEAHQTT